jgi:RNA polymerase sigma-70 factor, ECF subfamily
MKATEADETIRLPDLLTELASLRPALIRHAMHLTGNLADAEDLVHAAFEKALRRRLALRPDTRLFALLSKITKNLAIDLFRQSWRSRATSDDVSELPSRDPEPRPWWIDVEGDEVAKALVGCSPTLRETFELRHYGRLSLDQIALRTGTPINTVATRIFRARRHVRSVLESTRARAA